MTGTISKVVCFGAVILVAYFDSARSVQIADYNLSRSAWSHVKNTLKCWCNASNAHWILEDHPQIKLDTPCLVPMDACISVRILQMDMQISITGHSDFILKLFLKGTFGPS